MYILFYCLTTFLFRFTWTWFHGHFGGTLALVIVTNFFDSYETTFEAFLVRFLVDTDSLRGNPACCVRSFCWVTRMLAFVIRMALPLAEIAVLRSNLDLFSRSAFLSFLRDFLGEQLGHYLLGLGRFLADLFGESLADR